MVTTIGGRRDPPAEFIQGLTLGIESRTGELTATWRVSAYTEDSLVNVQTEEGQVPVLGGFFTQPLEQTIRAKIPDHYDIEINFGVTNLGSFQRGVRSRIEDLAGQAGIRAQLLLNQAQGLTGTFNLPSPTEEFEVPVGQGVRGERVFSIEPMRIPVPEGESIVDQIEQDVWPTMDFTVTASAPTFGGSVLVFQTGQKTYSMKIPPDAFIEEVEVSGDCEVLHNKLFGKIDSLRSRAQGARAGAEDTVSRLESISEELATEANLSTSGGPSTLAGRIEDLSSEDLVGISASRLREMRTTTEGADTKQNVLRNLRNTAENISSDIQNQAGQKCIPDLEDQLSEAQNIISELGELSGQASDLRNALLSALSGIESLDCGTAFSTIDREISNIESTVGVGSLSTSLTQPVSIDRFESIMSNINNIELNVEDTIPSDNPCRTQFLSRIDRSRRRLRDLQREEAEVLGCADIQKSVRDMASSVEGAVRLYVSKDQLARLPDRKEKLLQETEDAINEIQRNASDENPCKSELLSRVRDARERLQRTPARPKTAVPCEERFPEIGQQLDDFEDQVLSLSAPVDPETVQKVASVGDELTTMIDNQIPEDDPCRREMPERIRGLVQRVERLTTQIRIETNVQDEAAQRREELISQLLSSIDALQPAEDTDLDVDVPQT